MKDNFGMYRCLSKKAKLEIPQFDRSQTQQTAQCCQLDHCEPARYRV